MTLPLQVTVISDNRSSHSDLDTEHGLSLWVETPCFSFLMDTGVGKTFEHNRKKLGINFEKLNAIVFSHAHFDHTGALPSHSEEYHIPIYTGEGFFAPKYSKPDEKQGRYIGLNINQLEYLTLQRERLNTVTDQTEIFPGIHLFGNIPMIHHFEDLPQRFYLNESGTIPDRFIDEIAIAIKSPKGLVILSGCAHRGIINTITHICNRLDTHKIEAVIGGMHMGQVTQKRMDKTIEAFSRMGIQRLMPLHCSGDLFLEQLKHHFPTLFLNGGAGTRLKT